MRWSRFVDGQVKEAIESPGGFALSAVFCGFFAGMQLQELLSPPSYHHVNVWDYVSAGIFGPLIIGCAVGNAYVLMKAIRQLRGGKVGADTVTE